MVLRLAHDKKFTVGRVENGEVDAPQHEQGLFLCVAFVRWLPKEGSVELELLRLVEIVDETSVAGVQLEVHYLSVRQRADRDIGPLTWLQYALSKHAGFGNGTS